MKWIAVVAVLMLSAIPAFAADVDGTWTGAVSGPDGGEIPVSFTFKAEGDTLTGSTMGFDGSQVPIENGKMEGSSIAFDVTFDFGGMPFVLSYKGVVSASQIDVTGEAGGMPFAFVLEKAE